MDAALSKIKQGGTVSLRLNITDRQKKPDERVFNITVDSPDHSYLLASGINNYNCASFETMSGRVYHQFNRAIHVRSCPFNPDLPIWIGQDFNIDPMSSAIMQLQTNGELWIVDELHLPASNTLQVCEEIERRYWRYQQNITIYPDPAGNNRQHARGESDLDIFRERGFKRIKFRRKHPLVADRVNAVNKLLMDATGATRLYIDSRCGNVIRCFEQLLYKPETRDVDKASGFDHMGDALGYPIEMEFPFRRFEAVGKSF